MLSISGTLASASGDSASTRAKRNVPICAYASAASRSYAATFQSPAPAATSSSATINCPSAPFIGVSFSSLRERPEIRDRQLADGRERPQAQRHGREMREARRLRHVTGDPDATLRHRVDVADGVEDGPLVRGRVELAAGLLHGGFPQRIGNEPTELLL